jgi:hypothetical protein
MLGGQSPERAFQLVPLGDALLGVVLRRILERHQSEPRLPAPRMPDLGVAGVDEEPIEPRFQATVVAQGWQLPPGDEEGLLDRVLCSYGIAQDPIRDGVEPIALLEDEAGKRLLVPSLCATDEVGAHWGLLLAPGAGAPRLKGMSAEGSRMLNRAAGQARPDATSSWRPIDGRVRRVATTGVVLLRDAEGLIQIAKQLPDAPSTRRCRRVAAEHVDDDWCRAPASVLEVISTDIRRPRRGRRRALRRGRRHGSEGESRCLGAVESQRSQARPAQAWPRCHAARAAARCCQRYASRDGRKQYGGVGNGRAEPPGVVY